MQTIIRTICLLHGAFFYFLNACYTVHGIADAAFNTLQKTKQKKDLLGACVSTISDFPTEAHHCLRRESCQEILHAALYSPLLYSAVWNLQTNNLSTFDLLSGYHSGEPQQRKHSHYGSKKAEFVLLWHVSTSLKQFGALNGYCCHSLKHQPLNWWAPPEKCVDANQHIP